MKTIKFLHNFHGWLLSFFLVWSFSINGQNTNLPSPGFCYTDQMFAKSLEENPDLIDKFELQEKAMENYKNNVFSKSLNKSSGGQVNYLVPVVVYIVHDGGTSNISDLQVQVQIDRLNNEFSSHGIQFCLATKEGVNSLPGSTSNPGIIRITNPSLADLDTGTENLLLKNLSPSLPASKYLKIWVVEDIDNNSGLLGYANIPGGPPVEDGIVIRYDVFGDLTNPSCTSCTPMPPDHQEGKILVHEVGHYFGLFHVFNNQCGGANNATCDSQGDFVCDTPVVGQHVGDCMTITGLNPCTMAPANSDPLDNHMDYLNDVCRTTFTTGQGDRMICSINLYRSQLVSSSNLVYTGVECNGSLFAAFSADNYGPCSNSIVDFSAAQQQSSNVTYSWDFGDGNSANGLSVSNIYQTGGMSYNVTLTVTDGSTTISETQQIYVTDCTPIGSSQGNWYFYDGAGLDFSSGTPVADDSAWNFNTITANAYAYSNTEACAVQSDDTGNLLFYTDNIHVWDENHTLLNPGNDLYGNASTAGGTIILPDPNNVNEYYIFTNPTFGQINQYQGFRYSKVLVNGTSASMTTSINVPVLAPTNPALVSGSNNAIRLGEGITAIASCDGYWIIGNAFQYVNNNLVNYLVVYELTATGVSFHSLFTDTSNKQYAVLKASPDGTKLARASFAPTAETNVYDFNPATGIISNQVLLNTHVHPYGISFSPNSKLLYTASPYDGFYQYDVTAANPASTEIEVSSQFGFYALQLAPDQKIYGIDWGGTRLAVIHQPDVVCTSGNPNACIFSSNGPLLNTTASGSAITGGWGLPNMVDANTATVFNGTIIAEAISCYVYQFSVTNCGMGYDWDFGEPGAPGNISHLANPTYTFSGPGTYTVTLNLDGTLYTKTIEIGIDASIGGTTCVEPNIIYNYSSGILPTGTIYNWTSSSGGTIISLNGNSNVDVIWTNFPATLTLSVTDPETGCTDTSVITVVECVCEVTPDFYVSLDAKNRCLHYFNDNSLLGSGCNIVNWEWDFGDFQSGSNHSNLQNPTHVFSGNGNYTVCLTITVDCDGAICEETTCYEISVKNCKPCGCNIESDFFSSINGCIADFTNLSSALNECSTITNWSWNFGDPSSGSGTNANTSTLQNPSHTYSANGTYTVCLTIYGNNGVVECSDQICYEIEITDCKDCICDIEPNFAYEIDGCTAYFFDFSTMDDCITSDGWIWDFGDVSSSVSFSQNPTHIFSGNGTYEVCLTRYGYIDGELCIETICYEVEITNCLNCECELTSNFYYETDECTVYFNDDSDFNSCTEITNWSWNFGDPASGTGQNANTSSLQNPSHSYSANGTYTICLTISGNNDLTECQDTYCEEIEITNCVPCEKCELSPNFFYDTDGCTAYFGDDSSTNSCTEITNWKWDFGDPQSGVLNTSTNQHPSHTYSSNGTYEVCLTIEGNNGFQECQETYCYEIEIMDCDKEPCPDCFLNPDFSAKIIGCSVILIDFSTSDSCTEITNYYWEFGDPLSSQNTSTNFGGANHTYPGNGTYEICLTISGNNGMQDCSQTICYDIEINECDEDPCDECGLEADFEFDVNGCTVQFVDTSIPDDCTTLTNWRWNFGDPASGSLNEDFGQNPSHLFTSNGVYVVCLTVTGDNGTITCEESICYEIEIIDCENECEDCDLSPSFEWESEACDFTFYGTNNGTNCPTQLYSWEIYDNNVLIQSLSGNNTFFTFPYSGVFHVCLTIYVLDNNGEVICTETHCEELYAECVIPREEVLKVVAMPNPALDQVTFLVNDGESTLDLSEITIYDIKSNIVFKGHVSLNAYNVFDVSFLPPGLYFYQFNFSDVQSSTEKLVIINQ